MNENIIKLSYGGKLEVNLININLTRHLKRKRPALIICPGGGYSIHATKESAYPAYEYMAKGYQCFVLKYSVALEEGYTVEDINPNAVYPNQVLQLMESVQYIKQHADKFGVDEEMIYAMGFSAGGHVCASYAVMWNDAEITSQLKQTPLENDLLIRGIVLGYPFIIEQMSDRIQAIEQNEMVKVMSKVVYNSEYPSIEQFSNMNLINKVSENTIPMFIWHSVDDPVVNSIYSTQLVERLQQCKVPCEYHLFSHGDHGRSLANELIAIDETDIDTHLNTWILLAHMWMKRMR